MADIVVFPNCDLHVALNGAPQLTIRIFRRDPALDGSFTLTDVTSSCSFDFFAPHNAVGNRLQQFATIDPPTGLVTPTAVGTNLIQIRFNRHYIIARLQVHDRILGWWFGNSSITTALDTRFAHAQPSIYASFSDDPSGTDLVGDITGHGYVTLTADINNPVIFTVNADGRLQGVSEGPSNLTGNFLGVTHTLPVTVVDYAKPRTVLDYVQIPNVEHPETMHNILFIPEGFRDTHEDREKFDKIVTKVVDEMFDKPRHSPYNLLEGSFNIWKAYAASRQHAVTCGFRVNEQATPKLGTGRPIPFNKRVSSDQTIYTIELLVRKVGLPTRGETRTAAQLKTLWGSQSLDHFEPSKVDDDLVAAWKVQQPAGILEARDTFFGIHLGARPGDQRSGFVDPPVLPPGADDAAHAADVAAFVKQLYEWFKTLPSRVVSPDPRRHPPELQAGNRTNPGNSIMAYIGNLQDRFGTHANVGREWVPDSRNFKKSRGFVALITYEGMIGGANFNDSSITGISLTKEISLSFQFGHSGNEHIMRRTPPADIDENIDQIINTVAHEFGHSFNLGDEYESFPGDDPDAGTGTEDFDSDNLARIAAINLDANFLTNRNLDPDKIKWFDLLRIQLSDKLIKDSENASGQLKVTIDRRFIGKWVAAKQQNLEAFLRKLDFTPTGQQFPLKFDDDHYLVRLVIGEINETEGTILLGGPELPSTPAVFPTGSFLFIPKRDSSGALISVVEKKVLDKLKATNRPLNQNPDFSEVNREADYPVEIADFKPPCTQYKLIGVYEGGHYVCGLTYRPTGLCKMRDSDETDAGVGEGEFCFVCKYLIVMRVDPGLLGILDGAQYPTAKKND